MNNIFNNFPLGCFVKIIFRNQNSNQIYDEKNLIVQETMFSASRILLSNLDILIAGGNFRRSSGTRRAWSTRRPRTATCRPPANCSVALATALAWRRTARGRRRSHSPFSSFTKVSRFSSRLYLWCRVGLSIDRTMVCRHSRRGDLYSTCYLCLSVETIIYGGI